MDTSRHPPSRYNGHCTIFHLHSRLHLRRSYKQPVERNGSRQERGPMSKLRTWIRQHSLSHATSQRPLLLLCPLVYPKGRSLTPPQPAANEGFITSHPTHIDTRGDPSNIHLPATSLAARMVSWGAFILIHFPGSGWRIRIIPLHQGANGSWHRSFQQQTSR